MTDNEQPETNDCLSTTGPAKSMKKRTKVVPKQIQLTTLDHQQRMKRPIDDLKAKGHLFPFPSDSTSGKSEEDPNR